jgi:hypothetical protein
MEPRQSVAAWMVSARKRHAAERQCFCRSTTQPQVSCFVHFFTSTGCDKQAQGTHDGMCKRHWKSINCPAEQAVEPPQPPPPQGASVYDTILPASIAFRPGNSKSRPEVMQARYPNTMNSSSSNTWDHHLGANDLTNMSAAHKRTSAASDPFDPPRPPPGTCVMPLITFLMQERHREPGWHRNAERRARGMFLVANLSQQLEPWERQLVSAQLCCSDCLEIRPCNCAQFFAAVASPAGSCGNLAIEWRNSVRQLQG